MEEVDIDSLEDMHLVWEVVDLAVCEKFGCSKCKSKLGYHPKYIEAGVAGCSRCENIETIARRMLEHRGYTFISMTQDPRKKYITFRCPEGHIHTQEWTGLRKGYACNVCRTERSPKKEKVERERPECECKSLNKGKYVGPSYVCEHYNFAVLCPEAMKNWCFDLNNGVDPYQLPPATTREFRFRCDKYNETYPQALRSIYYGNGCPYCNGNMVCVGNSLYTTHPEIAKTWHPDNEMKPWDVFSGTDIDILWLCDNGNSEHEYERTVHKQTIYKGRCPMCAKGYAQRTGGHEEFVRASRQIHGDKYEYPDQFIKADIAVNIHCKVISRNTGKVHGLFPQMPSEHKRGDGCPKCSQERKLSIGANTINAILIKWKFVEDIHYFLEHEIEGMMYINELRFDFYIKERMCGNIHPIAIEFDHSQHFEVMAYGQLVMKIKREI